MKKEYSKPEISVIDIDTESLMLSASGVTSISMDDSDTEYGDSYDSDDWVQQR